MNENIAGAGGLASEAPDMVRAPEPDSEPMSEAADVPYDEVALEAYSLYCERGCQDGDDVGDWLAAEQIVRERRRSGNRVS